MKRRAVLAAVGALPAGALGGLAASPASGRSDDCALELRSAKARFEPRIPQGEFVTVELEVASGEACPEDLHVTVLQDGERLFERTVSVDPGTSTTVEVSNRSNLAPGEETATVRIADGGGTVLAERRTSIDDYRDEPGHFFVSCSSVEPRTAWIGAPVVATLHVGNAGYAPAFEARLLVDGEPVATTRGDAGALLSDVGEPCEGPAVSLTTGFLAPGTYDLRAVVEPRADEGSGSEVDLGTVGVGATPLTSRRGVEKLVAGGAVLEASRRVSTGTPRDGVHY